MDSISKNLFRQDLQELQEYIYFRFPDETGNTPIASRQGYLFSALFLAVFLQGEDKGLGCGK